MAPRFFADETDLGLGKALVLAHDGVVHPGILSCPKFRAEPSMTSGYRSSDCSVLS